MSLTPTRANVDFIKGIRCPRCHQTERFALQVTMNVVMKDNGMDIEYHPPGLDHLSNAIIDGDRNGIRETDPISCRGCGRKGTVAAFRPFPDEQPSAHPLGQACEECGAAVGETCNPAVCTALASALANEIDEADVTDDVEINWDAINNPMRYLD